MPLWDDRAKLVIRAIVSSVVLTVALFVVVRDGYPTPRSNGLTEPSAWSWGIGWADGDRCSVAPACSIRVE